MIDMAVDAHTENCRRLFLRNWQPGVSVSSAHSNMSVDVEIFVRYEDSYSSGDDLTTVVDYNVMRDTLLSAGDVSAPGFIDRVQDTLMRGAVALAVVKIRDKRTGLETSSKRCSVSTAQAEL
jgi:hypothetical protein